jgi:hypothetical protein
MSASPAPADTCPSCGIDLPLNARFCPACGTTLDGSANSTVRTGVPPDETGPVPVHVQRAEPRWFGMTPPHLLLGVAAAVCVVAFALFATGRWQYGLILLGIGCAASCRVPGGGTAASGLEPDPDDERRA